MDFSPFIGMIILGISLGLVLPIFLAYSFRLIMKQAGKSREFDHAERMKALELGKPIDSSEEEKSKDKYQHNAFWISFWMAAGVPISATSSVASVIVKMEMQEFRTILAMWICRAVISVAGVVGGIILMIAAKQSANAPEPSRKGPCISDAPPIKESPRESPVL